MDLTEYDQALRKLKQAQQNFELADPQYIDIAIHELNAAQLKVDAIIKDAKAC